MSSLNINSPPRLKSESSLGRLPWFDKTGAPASPYLIGIAGGSGSGKTSVANSILKTLNIPWIALLQMDSYYKPLTPDQSELAFKNEFDFDHPSCFDYETLLENLTDLKNNRAVNVPIYDFKTHSRSSKTTQIYGANVIIFEGIFTLFNPQVRKLFNLTIFVDTDSDIRLARRLKRDVAERSRDVIGVLKQYISFVKPSFDLYVKQTMKYANIILPRGLDNVAAINVITRHVFERLNDRGIMFLRNELATMEVEEFTENVVVLESDQIKGMHTIIRNPDCTRHDFVFYADRISRLVIEWYLKLI